MQTSLATSVEVNDVHSQLNRTQVQQIARPKTGAELKRVVQDSTKISSPVANTRWAASSLRLMEPSSTRGR